MTTSVGTPCTNASKRVERSANPCGDDCGKRRPLNETALVDWARREIGFGALTGASSVSPKKVLKPIGERPPRPTSAGLVISALRLRVRPPIHESQNLEN